MTHLVIGRGAEDVEDPLGSAVLSTQSRGEEAIGLDLVSARRSCMDGDGARVLRWLLSQEAPTRVLLVGDHGASPEELAPLLEAEGREVELLSLEEALDLLATLAAPRTRVVSRDRAPRVTLAMAVYNQEAYIDAVLRSALDQTYDDYEVLVLDDGSTDATPQIIDRFASDDRLRVVRQENLGQTGRMDLVNNRLVRHSRGELLAVVGGDDLTRPDRLRAQVGAFDEDPALDVCHGAMAYIGADGQPLGHDLRLPITYDGFSQLRHSVLDNLVAHPTVMVRRSAHERLALYAEGLVSDYELWLKTAGRLRFRYLPQRLTDYRVHDRSLSTSVLGHQRCLRESARIVAHTVVRRGLEDFFPELALDGAKPSTWYAAGLHLGNLFMKSQPALALHLYELALEHRAGAEAHQNAALAHLALQQLPEARERAGRASAIDPALGGLARMLTGGPDVPLRLLGHDSHLAAAIQAARGQAITCGWDGRTTDATSTRAAVDPRRPDLAARAVQAWACRTQAGSATRWVVPTLGLAVDQVLALLLADGAPAELSGAAELVIDEVDDAGLLPHDVPSPLVLSDERALATFLAALPVPQAVGN